MPPGPAFNWFCLAHSVVDILSNAAQIKANQLAARAAPLAARTKTSPQKRRRVDRVETPEFAASAGVASNLILKDVRVGEINNEGFSTVSPKPDWVVQPRLREEETVEVLTKTVKEEPIVLGQQVALEPPNPTLTTLRQDTPSPSPIDVHTTPLHTLLKSGIYGEGKGDEGNALLSPEGVEAVTDGSNVIGIPETPSENLPLEVAPTRHLQSSKVPSSRIGRLFHYGSLAASLGYGAASELVRRSTSSTQDNHSSSLMMTEGNVKRLVSKLTQMRGAALKLGQFMSIQDSHVLPPEIEDLFRRVQDSAHYMPDWQMEEVLRSSLGPSWQDHFTSFDRLPFAAASIGQVHSAVLASSSSPTGKEEPVAVKIQFPNIVNSIQSDLSYVKLLLTAGSLLPKGLFLDRTLEVMKTELADECDYTREASFIRKFALPNFLGTDSRFKVPWVWEGSTDRVLVMEKVDGVSVGGSVIDGLSQRDRNDIASRIVDLCLKELFQFRLMQTDPNWTNFLWNSRTRQVELVDFGATREYSKDFIDNWLHLLQAAASEDRNECIEWSLKLGYLTGEENEVMMDAHVKSMTLLATPFKTTTPQPFAFGPGSTWADITAEIRSQIPVMLKHRLTPPPRETYSLNRKLSGAFLLAARLDAKVDSRQLWERMVEGYRFDDQPTAA